jgi:hypothetical protein
MNLAPENKLLLCCARNTISEGTLIHIKALLSRPLDWNEVLKSAQRHGIKPLLYHHLNGIPEHRFIPQHVILQLEEAYHGSIAGNMYLYAVLSKILDAFREKGIKIIILKGAGLAKTVYANIGLRPMRDIDLLVKKKDLACIKEIMSDLHYGTREGFSEEHYRKNHFHLPLYVHPEKPTLEIHWHIVREPSLIDIEQWWERAGVLTIGSGQSLLPSPEDMLIHLCLHLFNHGYKTILLRDLCDISETAWYYRKEINWKRLQNEINRCEIQKPVYTILSLVNALQPDDENPLCRLDSAYVDPKFLALLQNQIFRDKAFFSAFPNQFVQSIAVDKFSDGLTILLEILFPSREVMAEEYQFAISSKKIYGYYLIHFIKILLKYGSFRFGIWRLKQFF